MYEQEDHAKLTRGMGDPADAEYMVQIRKASLSS
jgi:hypothetical protein